MSDSVNFIKGGVSIQQLYATKATATQIEKIEELSTNGFTQKELEELTKLGIDINPLVNNFETDNIGEAKSNGSTITAGEIATLIADLKEKYAAETGSGDPYSSSNPQLLAFQRAINDGLISDLGNAGYSKAQIIDVISAVFPSIGINATGSGGYTCPYGHGDDAKAIYEKFTQELIAAAGTSPEIQALQQEILSLNFQITSNNNQMQSLKATIERLQNEVEKQIEQAIEDSEDIAAEQKQVASSIVKSELNAYTSANGDMTYEEFQMNLAGKLDSLSSDGNSKMSTVIRNMMDAESKMDTLKGFVAQMGSLIKENVELSEQITTKSANLEQLKAELVGAEDPDCQKCDPIGFTSGTTRYDFFVDKDNNGDLSNEKEFLGADSGWSEMAALDTNADGKVDKNEMSDLKMVVTNSDGTQSVQNASDLFSDTDSIDLTSYKSINQEMDNGNTLLGTFDLTFNGENIDDGYNTLDRLDWLDANYDFSDKDSGTGRFAKDEYTPQESLDFNDIFAEFENNVQNLDVKLTQAWSNVGINQDEVQSKIVEDSNSRANAKAKVIEENFEQTKYNQEVQEIEKEKRRKAELEKVQTTQQS